MLLRRIWDGTVTALPGGETGRLAALIETLLPITTITLRSTVALGGDCVLPESEELLPGLSLGDVLAEELGLDVPYGALILVEESADIVGAGMSGHEIEGLLDQVMRDLGGAAAPVRPAAAMAVPPLAGFRDHRLNARFFREVGGAVLGRERAQGQQAAG